MELYETNCCGLIEIDCIREHETFEDFYRVFQACRGEYIEFNNPNRTNVYYFTDAKEPGQKTPSFGDKIAAAIKKNRLGTILKTKYVKNPKSGNNVCTYVWVLNKKAGAV